MSQTPEDLNKAYRVLVALVITVVVAASSTIAVRASYGAFSNDFRVSGMFTRAGQSLKPGSDVKYRGVTVGKVRSIKLVDREALITLSLHHGTKVPATARATVRPKTLFGEKYVELAYQRGAGAPYLHKGSKLESTGTGDEVEQLVAGVDHLLRGVNTTQLAGLMTELTQAAQGEGEKVAGLIDRGMKAADVLQTTLDDQITALDSLQRFVSEYRDIAPDINGIGANLNQMLPVFNAARADFERLLTTLRPFSDDVADLLETNEPNIDQILDHGGNIVRVIVAHKKDLSDVVYGLSRYVFKFAKGASKETLPDGSKFAYFKVFIDLTDIRQLICSVITTPAPSQLPQLGQLQAALTQANPLLSCGSKAGSGALDSTLGPNNPVTGSGNPVGTAASAPSPQAKVSQDILSALAQPQAATGGGAALNSLFGPLLGAAG